VADPHDLHTPKSSYEKAPLRLVADAFLCAHYRQTDPFED